MLNSVAKYLWGGVENEADYSGRAGGDQQVQEKPSSDGSDWVLVDTVDKENCCQTAHTYHQNHHHHSYHHATTSTTHQQKQQPQGHHDSIGCQGHATCDLELLDDAASLAHHLASKKSSRFQMPESRLPNIEPESVDSSDFEESGIDSGRRPSSPESVFSACSGRSHATYRPQGHASEAWVVAPPPCFTGSQISSSEPLASSPLENLLIEHPSMSVYFSVPSSALPPSHPLFSLPAITDPLPEAGVTTEGESVSQAESSVHSNDDATTALSLSIQLRRHSNQAALHPIQLSPEKLLEKSHIAQRSEISQKQKGISKRKCHRWNLMQAYSSSPKRSNRHNKLMRPSGCKSSRTSQRLH